MEFDRSSHVLPTSTAHGGLHIMEGVQVTLQNPRDHLN
jgi:hypothetical protein